MTIGFLKKEIFKCNRLFFLCYNKNMKTLKIILLCLFLNNCQSTKPKHVIPADAYDFVYCEEGMTENCIRYENY